MVIMPIFIVVPETPSPELLNTAVETKVSAQDKFSLPGGHGWLVKFDGTSTELSHKLGISTPDNKGGPAGPALVALMSSYYGRGPVTTWEWIASRWDQ